MPSASSASTAPRRGSVSGGVGERQCAEPREEYGRANDIACSSGRRRVSASSRLRARAILASATASTGSTSPRLRHPALSTSARCTRWRQSSTMMLRMSGKRRDRRAVQRTPGRGPPPDRRPHALLRRDQQPEPAQPPCRTWRGGQRRDERSRDQADDGRREPQRASRASTDQAPDGEDQSRGDVPAMRLERLGEGKPAMLAPLRRSSRNRRRSGSPTITLDLNEHHDRRKHRRHEELEQEAHDTAARRRRPSAARRD